MGTRREHPGISGDRGRRSIAELRDVGPDLQTVRMVADVRVGPWVKMSASASGDLVEELLERAVGDALRYLQLQNVRPTRDGTRLPYPQRFSRRHVPL
jgi:hypothetical protein